MHASILSHRLKYIAVGLLIFIGISAIGGGLMLILDPTGNSMDFSLDLLDATPFNDYLIPGCLLITLIGFLSLIVAWIVKNQWKYANKLLITQGLIIIFWLSIQLFLNIEFYMGIYHIPLYFMGISIIFIGIILSKQSNFK